MILDEYKKTLNEIKVQMPAIAAAADKIIVG